MAIIKCPNCGKSISDKAPACPYCKPASPKKVKNNDAHQNVLTQISTLPSADTYGTKKEIKHLAEILRPDEKIYGLTSGVMNNNTWLITCTNHRVIFLDKGLIYGIKQSETPIEKINSIEHSTGLMLGEISIWDGAARMTIKNCLKKSVKPFVDAVNRAIHEHRQQPAPVTQQTPDQVDVVAQLEKLADLKTKGILTEEEFAAQKAKILSL